MAGPWVRGRLGRQRVEAKAAIRQKLDARLARLAFHGAPLRRAIETLQAQSGLAINADWERLREQGADPEEPVYALFEDRVAHALDAMLDVAAHNGRISGRGSTRLSYVAGRESVTLRPAQEIGAETSCLEVHDVTALLDLDKVAAPDVETIEWQIEQAITSVAPGSWRRNGGFGDCCCRGGRLIVVQTPDRQAEVAVFLASLREDYGPSREQVRLLRRLRGEGPG